MKIPRWSKYPLECACGEFLKNKFSAMRHYKICFNKFEPKSQTSIDKDSMYDAANLKLDAIERDLKCLWLSKYPDSSKFK